MTVLLMREIKMHVVTDEKWGFEKGEVVGDVENPRETGEKEVAS